MMLLKCCNIIRLLLPIISLVALTEAVKIPAGIFYLIPKAFSSSATTYDDRDDYVPYRSDEHDQFTWHLLKSVLNEEQQSNIMISPFSVQLVLTLLSEAAANNTRTQCELVNTLSNVRAHDNVHGFYQKILKSMKKEKQAYNISLSTKLYADVQVEPQQRYIEILKQFYDTEIEQINFAQPEQAAASINAWCNRATNGRLQDLVSPESVRGQMLLIVNAIYFHGYWRREFRSAYQRVFFKTAPANQQIKADFMEQTGYFYYNYSNSLDAQILRLPYKGNRFSMFIVLPKRRDGLSELLLNMESGQLKSSQWLMEKAEIQVTLPKFKFAYKADLKRTLQKLGISDIFSDSASLPGLGGGNTANYGGGKLSVSNIYQKSGIDVNERGTVAFAATAVEIVNKFGLNIDLDFTADHPFMFFIEEETTGNILFAGKVMDPTI